MKKIKIVLNTYEKTLSQRTLSWTCPLRQVANLDTVSILNVES